MRCILCDNDDTETLEQIKVDDITTLYKKWLNCDVSTEFDKLKLLSYIECSSCGLKFFYPIIAGSDKFYEVLSHELGFKYYQEEKAEYKFAANYISAEDSVLDVGSGRGLFSKYVKGKYTGLDFNSNAVAQAVEDCVNVVNMSIEEHINKPFNKYSVVTAFQVLEHIPTPGKFIETCLEALSPGGLLILSVPSEDSYVSLQENAILNMPPHHVSRWRDRSLLNLENLFGLKLVSLAHQKLESIHFENYVELLAHRTVRSLLKLHKNNLIDLSIEKRLVNKLSRYISPLITKIVAESALWPDGHSVTIVFRK